MFPGLSGCIKPSDTARTLARHDVAMAHQPVQTFEDMIMKLPITKTIASAFILTFSLNALAESQADQRTEYSATHSSHLVQHVSQNRSAVRHASNNDNSKSEYKLKYTAGAALKAYPDLTAHQRRQLVFGSK